MLLHLLFNLSRAKKKIILISFDLLVLFMAFAISTRYSFEWRGMPVLWLSDFITTALLTVVVFSAGGFYSTMIRYLDSNQILKILLSALASTVFYIGIKWANGVVVGLGVATLYGGLVSAFVVISRLLIVELYGLLNNASLIRTLVYGTDKSSAQFIHLLKGSDRIRLVAVVNEADSLHGVIVSGFKVYKSSDLEKLIKTKRVEQVLVADGFGPGQKRKDLIERLQSLPVTIKIYSSFGKIDESGIEERSIRDIDIRDLLGKELNEPVEALLNKNIKGKVVLVTGAGGSIGSEICYQITKLSPSHLLLLDISENALLSVEKNICQRIQNQSIKFEYSCLLADVLDKERIKEICETYKVNTIYHAAAYKQVPMLEHNIVSSIKINVLGSWACASAAYDAEVDNFILISTDKAVRSTNVMGASKFLAEKIVQAYGQRARGKKYCIVRYGNVLESSDSVVDVFREQIKRGGPITVTHPNVSRYFIPVNDAAQLIIQASALAKRGEVFVLDMGEPIKIVELAEKILRTMGLSIKSDKYPNGDIEIKYCGLRPGEKLFEEISVGDNPCGTEHPQIMCADEVILPFEYVEGIVLNLQQACRDYDCVEIRNILQGSDIAYSSNEKILDWVWQRKNSNWVSSNDCVISSFPTEKDVNLI